ncbi:MAG: protein kinase domain-containing protein, partial [Pirellulales bacterium]
MPVSTPDEFWQLLVRSRLLEPDAEAALRAEHAAILPATAGDGSVKSIAVWLCGRGVLTRWQAKRLVSGDSGPFRLGDYRLLERHDRDGDGLLFTARHDPSERVVFLMLLNAKRCRELDVWTEIVRRTTIAHRAADPMLSRTWSLEQQAGTRFIICEHVAGASLADEVERLGPLPPQQAGLVAWHLARAVAELHGLGDVHGGVSLDVLRREATPGSTERNGRVRLLQFPLSGDPHRVPLRPLVANDAEFARLGQRAAFVAPELLVPDATCTERSDVYAIGAAFSTLLVGVPPCWNGDPRLTLQRASFQGPAALPEAVPAAVAELVGSMMARDPRERYATAREAADAIAVCLGLSAPPTSPATHASPPPQTESFPASTAVPTVAAAMVSTAATVDGMPIVVVDPGSTRATPHRGSLPRASSPIVARRMWMIGGLAAVAILAGAVAFVIGRVERGEEPRDAARPPRQRVAETRRRADEMAAPLTAGAAAVATETDTAADSIGAVGASARQIVVDDPALPWASPTSGPPPTLAYLPPGSQLVLLARLAEISADDEGQLFLKSLGPAAEEAVAALVKLCGGDIAAIECVQAGWQAGGPDEVVGGFAVWFAGSRVAPADEASRQEAWGATTEITIDGERVYQSSKFSFWPPSAEQGRVLVIAPRLMVAKDVTVGSTATTTEQEPLMATIIRESLAMEAAAGTGLATPLPRDLEVLVGMLDAQRHVTVFGSPQYLLNAGRPLLAGPLARLIEPLDALFGESLQAAALSLHFGENAYLEMDAVPSLEVPARKRAPELAARVDGLAAQVERACTSLDPDPYGRVLVLRLPAMLRTLSAQVRAAAEGKSVVLNAYLPRHAPHNLALAAEIALAQTPVEPGSKISGPTAVAAPE